MHCGHMITLNVQSLCSIELQLVYCAQPKKVDEKGKMQHYNFVLPAGHHYSD